ncbi:hypothetical protein ABAC460_04045 [Asticcacaulis sp. AC460]|uniref:hypothetical protein n=1 Tax=Asticcacaulis sp. AC460 TaxID=1282360 RepID=UPI0003C3DB1F|nr:hypothetical protein [Asticcacaulis sp. AC460]ESQ92067.1 hypothetical protein ABAC460_04045 [Asticcacaulis sp. AC460]
MNLDALVRDRIKPTLDHAGFKARGRTFRRTTDGFEHLMEVGRGQRSMEGRFCITLYAHPRVSGYPGLPEFPLRSGDYWLSHRLTPAGLDDQWWPVDPLSSSDGDQIMGLIEGGLAEWFSDLQCLSRFSADWFRRMWTLDHAAARLGLLPARLAYLQAAVFAEQGKTDVAGNVAETAYEQAGPRAVMLQAWIRQFQSGLADC